MDIYTKFMSVVGMLRSSMARKASRSDLAPAFSALTEYAAGQLTIYSDTLYRCVASHKGAWDASHFARASVEDVLDDISTTLQGKADRSDLRYYYMTATVDIGSDASLPMESDREVYVVTLASESEVTESHSIAVTLPSADTSVKDLLLRVDALDAVKYKPLPKLSFDEDNNIFITETAGWNEVSAGVNVFTFTSLGALSGKSVWLVGKVVSEV